MHLYRSIMMTFQSLLLIVVLFAFSHAQSNSSENTTGGTDAPDSTSERTSTTILSPPRLGPLQENIPTWTVKSSDSTCLLVRGNFTFVIAFTTPAGNAVSDRVDIPTSAKASGSCGPFVNSLILTWDKSNLTFMFIKKPIFSAGVDRGEGSFSLTTIFGRLTVENPNDSNGSNGPAHDSSPRSTSSGRAAFYISLREPGYMSTPLHNSYLCESYQSLAADKSGSVYLEMKSIQVEAFHNGTDANFSQSQQCTKDTMSSIMSVLGYVALAVLVAAVAGCLTWKKFGHAGYTEV